VTLFPRERQSAFDRTEFIGWDCEGVNHGKVDEWTDYQRLVLIANSAEKPLYNENGIPIHERLRYIANVAQLHPQATHVFFGGSYDFNKILEGLPKAKVEELHESKRWVVWHDEWVFRYRPRKELVIAHLRDDVTDLPDENVKEYCDSYIRFWDVIGFFQCSFIHAVKTWLGPDYHDAELIAAGKLARLHFADDDKDFMIRYNDAEVRALVEIMKLLHAQLSRLGLKLSRWDGAGAVAAEIFKRYRLVDSYFSPQAGGKPLKIELPAEIMEATRYAYFGGRIESGKMGRYQGTIYNYDINSAYPYAAAQLPNLNNGSWRHHHNPSHEQTLGMNGLAMIRVRWYFHTDRLYYPFPFRTLGGAVIFPREGERWIYAEEVKSAIRSIRKYDQIECLEAWEFREDNADHPNTFEAITQLYTERQQMVAKGDPAEKVIKLGLNSIYGKLCQKLGWNEADMLSPRYHFLLFAGYITSYTRARIYDAVAQKMDDVIAICTDGLITSSPLDIVPSTDKTFGAWSLEMNEEICQLQSGVYWLRKGMFWKEKARGLGRVVGEGTTEEERKRNQNEKIIARIESVESGWSSNDHRIYFPVKLFITSKKACTGKNWFPRWGHWYEMHDEKAGKVGRGLELLCSGWGKRRLTKRIFPGRLTNTVAAENIAWGGDGDLGEPYELPWIDGNARFADDEDIEDI
jgi:hypothetical protein